MQVQTAVPFIPHIARAFQSYPGSNYILPSDEKEAERLQLQHEVLKSAFEGRVLLAPFRENGSYFVLDSGVGSGAWLLDLSTALSSSAILHGVDIEGRLFPKEHQQNVSFSIGSVTKLPREWSDKFDFVHQRLLVAALRMSEWPTAVAEIHRVLRPGGWIQLGEVGTWHAGPVTERHLQLLYTLFKSRELLLDVHTGLPDLLRAANYQNISVEKRSMPLGKWAGQKGIDARDNFMGVFRGMKTPILKSGGLGIVKSEAELDNLLDDLENEWDATEGAEISFYIVTAQKARLFGDL